MISKKKKKRIKDTDIRRQVGEHFSRKRRKKKRELAHNLTSQFSRSKESYAIPLQDRNKNLSTYLTRNLTQTMTSLSIITYLILFNLCTSGDSKPPEQP